MVNAERKGGKTVRVTIKATVDQSLRLKDPFPGQEFVPHPSLDESMDRVFPDLYKEIIASMPTMS